jgi:hypothetical protein
VGFLWALFCGLAGLFLCILHVYLGTSYTFLIKFFYFKKKENILSPFKSKNA